MNILKNLWTYLTAKFSTKTNEVKTVAQDVTSKVVETVETPYEAVKQYVRDTNGRFASKVAEVKEASKELAEQAVQEEQKSE